MLLGAPDAGQGARVGAAEPLGQREQVVVEVALVEERGGIGQADVQPQRERAAELLTGRAQKGLGRVELVGQPDLVPVAGPVPAREPGRDLQPQRRADGHRECRVRRPGIWPCLPSRGCGI